MSSKKNDNSESIQNASLLEQSDFFDSDLQVQVQKTAGDPELRDIAIKHYTEVQRQRNEKRERQSRLTPNEKRRENARDAISSQELLRGDIHHIHSVLALCTLPYKRPPEDQREHGVQYGYNSLRVEAGSLMNPETGLWERQGIPYGPKARLLQLHICTRALRNNNPVVDIEDSMSAFIASMGFAVTGGARGTITQFKEQMNRLAACSMKLGLWDGHSRAKTVSVSPIKSFEVWFPQHEAQQILWPSQVVLNQDFFESLSQHSLPVDIRSLAAISNSSRQIDLLMWLSYRVRNMERKYFLKWDVLKKQFCQSQKMRMTEFKRDFKKDIHTIESIFDKPLPIQLTEEGVFLLPCDPESLFVPSKNTKHLPTIKK